MNLVRYPPDDIEKYDKIDASVADSNRSAVYQFTGTDEEKAKTNWRELCHATMKEMTNN